MKVPVIFDVDTGIDDAVAIMLGVNLKKFDIKLCCGSQGNTSAKNAAQNTLNILEMIGAPQIDVAIGSERPFRRATLRTRTGHGENGLGDYVFPPHNRKPCKENFVDKYFSVLSASKKPVTIIVLGPLTNIAYVLDSHPQIATKIKQIYFMGSTFDKPEGEKPYAGFNVACDPEALEKIMELQVPIVFCPNNFGRDFALTQQEVERTRLTNDAGAIFAKIFQNYHDNFVKSGVAMYDAITCFACLFPRHTKISPVFMQIKHYPLIKTALAIPHLNLSPNAHIITRVNGQKMKDIFFKALKKCK